jgi:hypothetical protein
MLYHILNSCENVGIRWSVLSMGFLWYIVTGGFCLWFPECDMWVVSTPSVVCVWKWVVRVWTQWLLLFVELSGVFHWKFSCSLFNSFSPCRVGFPVVDFTITIKVSYARCSCVHLISTLWMYVTVCLHLLNWTVTVCWQSWRDHWRSVIPAGCHQIQMQQGALQKSK